MLLLAQKEVDALLALSERHSRLAYSLAFRILGDPGWAEEVVQDVLLRLWNRPEMYDPARGDLRAWLLRVVHNAAVSGLRSKRGSTRTHEQSYEAFDLFEGGTEDPADAAWRTLKAEAVRAAIETLPSAQRRTLEMAYYDGLSQSEIAERMGEPLGTVKTRVRLGLKKLRIVLEDSREIE